MKALDGPKPLGRMLVVVAHGRPLAVAWDAVNEDTSQWLSDFGASGETFALTDSFAFTPNLADGAWIGEIEAEDDGESDWGGGGREYVPAFTNERRATAEEWEAHCKGEWPWEPYKKDEVQT